MKYPSGCDSPRRKTEFLYRVQEDLRLLHNVFSKWLHEGLTDEEYASIPEKLKIKYPFEECTIIEKIVEEDYSEVAWAGKESEYEGKINLPDKKIVQGDPKLSKVIWDKFQKEDFTPRSNKICQEICVQRAELKKSSKWSVDIGEI